MLLTAHCTLVVSYRLIAFHLVKKCLLLGAGIPDVLILQFYYFILLFYLSCYCYFSKELEYCFINMPSFFERHIYVRCICSHLQVERLLKSST